MECGILVLTFVAHWRSDRDPLDGLNRSLFLKSSNSTFFAAVMTDDQRVFAQVREFNVGREELVDRTLDLGIFPPRSSPGPHSPIIRRKSAPRESSTHRVQAPQPRSSQRSTGKPRKYDIDTNVNRGRVLDFSAELDREEQRKRDALYNPRNEGPLRPTCTPPTQDPHINELAKPKRDYSQLVHSDGSNSRGSISRSQGDVPVKRSSGPRHPRKITTEGTKTRKESRERVRSLPSRSNSVHDPSILKSQMAPSVTSSSSHSGQCRDPSFIADRALHHYSAAAVLHFAPPRTQTSTKSRYSGIGLSGTKKVPKVENSGASWEKLAQSATDGSRPRRFSLGRSRAQSAEGKQEPPQGSAVSRVQPRSFSAACRGRELKNSSSKLKSERPVVTVVTPESSPLERSEAISFHLDEANSYSTVTVIPSQNSISMKAGDEMSKPPLKVKARRSKVDGPVQWPPEGYPDI